MRILYVCKRGLWCGSRGWERKVNGEALLVGHAEGNHTLGRGPCSQETASRCRGALGPGMGLGPPSGTHTSGYSGSRAHGAGPSLL